jgi:hypothetical protein
MGQYAINDKTGEIFEYDRASNKWKPVKRVINDKTGEQFQLVDNAWKPMAPTKGVVEKIGDWLGVDDVQRMVGKGQLGGPSAQDQGRTMSGAVEGAKAWLAETPLGRHMEEAGRENAISRAKALPQVAPISKSETPTERLAREEATAADWRQYADAYKANSIAAPVFDWWDRNIGDPMARGGQNIEAGLAAGKLALGGTPEEYAYQLAKQQRDQAAFPVAPNVEQARKNFGAQKGIGDILSYGVQNPGQAWDLLSTTFLESAPALGIMLTGGAATGAVGAGVGTAVAPGPGTAIGGVIGEVLGMGGTSAAINTGDKFNQLILDEMAARGLPVDQASVLAVMADPEFMASARSKAAKYGLTIGAFDGLSMGVAGRIVGPVSKALVDPAARVTPGVVARGTGAVAETGVQVGLGGGGEAAGQVASEGKITSPLDVVVEGILEGPSAAFEVPAAMASRGTLVTSREDALAAALANTIVGAQPNFDAPAQQVGGPQPADPTQPPAPRTKEDLAGLMANLIASANPDMETAFPDPNAPDTGARGPAPVSNVVPLRPPVSDAPAVQPPGGADDVLTQYPTMGGPPRDTDNAPFVPGQGPIVPTTSPNYPAEQEFLKAQRADLIERARTAGYDRLATQIEESPLTRKGNRRHGETLDRFGVPPKGQEYPLEAAQTRVEQARAKLAEEEAAVARPYKGKDPAMAKIHREAAEARRQWAAEDLAEAEAALARRQEAGRTVPVDSPTSGTTDGVLTQYPTMGGPPPAATPAPVAAPTAPRDPYVPSTPDEDFARMNRDLDLGQGDAFPMADGPGFEKVLAANGWTKSPGKGNDWTRADGADLFIRGQGEGNGFLVQYKPRKQTVDEQINRLEREIRKDKADSGFQVEDRAGFEARLAVHGWTSKPGKGKKTTVWTRSDGVTATISDQNWGTGTWVQIEQPPRQKPAKAPAAPAKPPAATTQPAAPPAPPAAPTPAPAPATGKAGRKSATLGKSTATTPDGAQTIDTEFEVLDAADLVAATGDLQPRDRAGRKTSDAQIVDIAADLKPDWLVDSPQTDRGSPIIDENNVLLTGNGRRAAIQLAKKNKTAGYDAYQQKIRDLGFDTEGMDTPILVRRTTMSEDQKRTFVVVSNDDNKQAMSPAEQARADADLITADILQTFDATAEKGVAAAVNQPFVRNVLSKLPANQQAAFLGKDGQLTPAGAKRLEAAIFAKAYGDPDLVDRIVEEEGDTAGIRNMLRGAAPGWAKMKADADPSYDITADLIAALDAVSETRSKNLTAKEWLEQGNMFGGLSPAADAIYRAIWNKALTRARAWADARDFLRDYASRAVRASEPTADMFGAAPPTSQAILSALLERLNNADQGDMFGGPANPGKAAAAPLKDSVTPSGGSRRGEPTTGLAPSREEIGSPELFDQGEWDPDTAPDEPDFEPLENSRNPPGTLAPTFVEYALTKGLSKFQQAFRDAGFDPEEASTFAPERQISILSKLLQSRFGFRLVQDTGRASRANARQAIDAMLDAYRNFQWMAHALGLPAKVLGLSGTLGLNIAGHKRATYFGSYDPNTNTIDITTYNTGRSNSFAHEWGHAFDHLLGTVLGNNPDLLSMEVRSDGLVNAPPSVETAFVGLMNALFFDQTKLAGEALALQVKASKTDVNGNPTPAAVKAAEQLARIEQGNSKTRSADSNYRQNAKAFGRGSPYWTNPAEMLARAFEAYVGFKVEAAGGTTEFLSKSDQGYLSTADARLAMTFPKDSERTAIFEAFNFLFVQLAHAQMFGIGGPDPIAAPPADVDILDPQKWNKMAAQQPAPTVVSAVQDDIRAARNIIGNIAANPKSGLKGWLSEWLAQARSNAGLPDRPNTGRLPWFSRAAHILATHILPADAAMRMIAGRNKDRGGVYFNAIIEVMAPKPGSGNYNPFTFDEEVHQLSRQVSNAIASAFSVNNLDPQRLTKDQRHQLRETLLGNAPAGTPGAIKSIAAAMRQQLNTIYTKAQEAGVEMGYVRNAGYLARIVDRAAVNDDVTGFDAAAREVYEIVFDNEFNPLADDVLAQLNAKLRRVRNNRPDFVTQADQTEIKAIRKEMAKANRDLRAAQAEFRAGNISQADLDAAAADHAQQMADLIDRYAAVVKPLWVNTAAALWTQAITLGDPTDFDTKGPLTGFTKERTLPPETDRIMEPFYVSDPVESSTIYAHTMARKIAFARRFGVAGAGAWGGRLDTVRKNDKNFAAGVAAKPSRYNMRTPEGRIRAIRELTNPAKHGRLEMLLQEALQAGANPEDVVRMRGMIQILTGMRTDPMGDAMGAYVGWASFLGTMLLMGRSAWTSVSEPAAVYFRTRSFRATMETFIAYVSEVVPNLQSVKDRRAFALAAGVVTAPFAEGMILASHEGQYADQVGLSKLTANFYSKVTFLPQLTNVQRRAAMAGGFYYLSELAGIVTTPRAGLQVRDPAVHAAMARAELLELGVPDTHIDSFAQWVVSMGGNPPSLDMLETRAGEIYGQAISRFASQVIQDPKRVNKPIMANTIYGRLTFSLMSFPYTFARNVHARYWEQRNRNVAIRTGAGQSRVAAESIETLQAAGHLAVGFGMVFAGQLASTIIREWIFNHDKWEEHEAKGDLHEWLFNLAASRCGMLGPLDALYQMVAGLRYERDLTSMLTGSYQSYILNQGAAPLFNLFFGRNGKSDTAERKATKAVYQFMVAPAILSAITVAPGGKVLGAVGAGLAQYAGSNQAGNQFTDMFFGEKEKKPPRDRD